jgi:hypothetical protein
MNASQPDLSPEGVFDGFIYLRADLLDRLHTNNEHTPATAWELADLRFSLNTLSKHYGIHCRILASRDLENYWKLDFVCRPSEWKFAPFGRVFAIYLKNSAYLILIRCASGRLDRASGRSSLKSFPSSNGILELSELLYIVRTCCRVVRTACR